MGFPRGNARHETPLAPGRRRNFAKAPAEVPRHRRVQLRRSRRRAGLDASGRRRVLRGRPLGARAISVWATHYEPVADLFSRNAPGTAWKSKPTWYIVANDDRAVRPDLQRFLAKRLGATTLCGRQQPRPYAFQPEPHNWRDPHRSEGCKSRERIYGRVKRVGDLAEFA